MLYPSYFRRGDPLDHMKSMLRDFDRSFAPATGRPRFPAVNVWQSDEVVAITAELPGVEPGEIDLHVKENVLTLSGERKAPQMPEGARWHRNERAFGKFSRQILLPFVASDDQVEARFQHGVLRILVGRPEKEKPKRIEIKAA